MLSSWLFCRRCKASPHHMILKPCGIKEAAVLLWARSCRCFSRGWTHLGATVCVMTAPWLPIGWRPHMTRAFLILSPPDPLSLAKKMEISPSLSLTWRQMAPPLWAWFCSRFCTESKFLLATVAKLLVHRGNCWVSVDNTLLSRPAQYEKRLGEVLLWFSAV